MGVQFRWPVGMPLCRPLGDGLWEVRSHADEQDTAQYRGTFNPRCVGLPVKVVFDRLKDDPTLPVFEAV
jgi:hypothetical protein